MTRRSLFLACAAAALVAALFWFLVVATASEWVGRLLAFAVLALTVLALVIRPGGSRPGDASAR